MSATCVDIMDLSDARFGTSGVRGLVDDLDDATCFAYTLAFLHHLTASHDLAANSTVWVGMDLRPSSPAMASACVAAVTHAGHKPLFCGVVPTPALAFSALQNRSPAIMVTGSHIPFDRNGIKFYRATGEMLKQDEKPILTSTAEFPQNLFQSGALKPPRSLPQADPAVGHNWKQRYRTAFSGALEGLTIGHYQHSAAGRDLLYELLQDLGAKMVPLARSETFVPIDTEAVSHKDAQQAREWVKDHNLDALISTDGDGDRPLLADETGAYFRGDTLGVLAARALKASHVVTPVSSNSALEKSGLFSAVLRTKIGSPHVIEAMQNAARSGRSGVVGFEANGGFLAQTPLSSPWNNTEIRPLPTRDSVLPVLSVIAMAQRSKSPLSRLLDLLPNRVTASDRLVDIKREVSLALIELLKAKPKQAATFDGSDTELVSCDETDGLRMTFASGDIVHIRPSGNAPEMRVYVESNSNEAAENLLQHTRQNAAKLISTL